MDSFLSRRWLLFIQMYYSVTCIDGNSFPGFICKLIHLELEWRRIFYSIIELGSFSQWGPLINLKSDVLDITKTEWRRERKSCDAPRTAQHTSNRRPDKVDQLSGVLLAGSLGHDNRHQMTRLM